ncbi:sulfotransferase domain-containing protein [Pseudalkalibacillus salsuginis]|uniref:sulfotransferase domain-containing protein n=1 Tax=Pseudalkalibacillus salsuginis TaxID=2910972 RepID=UPI001F2C35B4|nr:sulfotransferase domain-containing protein [Pseudalkalibacillus salsuginis]MCF6409958.1 sulfotransferase domain-containing protein [Pseudalkalibacillus salsuginis]
MKQYGNKQIQPFFANSIAKSGTHLLRPLLEGIPSLNHHTFIYPGRLDQLEEHRRILATMATNHFANGHLHYSPQYSALFKHLNMKQLFLYRDPRDIVVSYAYFFMKFKGHPYERYFTENNMNIKERCTALINGFNTVYAHRSNINMFYQNFLGWMSEANILLVPYESLVHSKESQRNELRKILRFLEVEKRPMKIEEIVNMMQANVDPAKSPTFRKGQAGNWQMIFDEEIKNQFKAIAGDLLIKLGYENNHDW